MNSLLLRFNVDQKYLFLIFRRSVLSAEIQQYFFYLGRSVHEDCRFLYKKALLTVQHQTRKKARRHPGPRGPLPRTPETAPPQHRPPVPHLARIIVFFTKIVSRFICHIMAHALALLPATLVRERRHRCRLHFPRFLVTKMTIFLSKCGHGIKIIMTTADGEKNLKNGRMYGYPRGLQKERQRHQFQ